MVSNQRSAKPVCKKFPFQRGIFTISFLFFFMLASVLFAQDISKNTVDSLKQQLLQLQEQINRLEQKQAQTELEQLKQQAWQQATSTAEKPEQKNFKSGQRSLQALNPEISVTGDAYLQGVLNEDGFTESHRSGAYFRVIGLHIQSNLDPFSLTKIALEVTPEGIELGEAYVTWPNALKNISLTAGKFRQQFGVLNRWHAHGLDQFEFPLALTTILGEEGLNQIGFSAEWLMPAWWAHASALTMQITNGQNDHLFAGSLFSFPAVLTHLKNYYDVNPAAYLEIGITGMVGENNLRGFQDGQRIDEKQRLTRLAGLDVTLLWEPLNKAHYHSFLWRSELYYADKQLSLNQNISALGGYSYAEFRFNEWLHAGLRLDYTQPFTIDNDGKYIYQVVPYITWWQSHWVRLRLQYNYSDGNVPLQTRHLIRLQLTWAAGPHKHERY
ncbi:hypothetical protein ACX8XP_16760 [Calditrichota bacterium LG25]